MARSRGLPIGEHFCFLCPVLLFGLNAFMSRGNSALLVLESLTYTLREYWPSLPGSFVRIGRRVIVFLIRGGRQKGVEVSGARLHGLPYNLAIVVDIKSKHQI